MSVDTVTLFLLGIAGSVGFLLLGLLLGFALGNFSNRVYNKSTKYGLQNLINILEFTSNDNMELRQRLRGSNAQQEVLESEIPTASTTSQEPDAGVYRRSDEVEEILERMGKNPSQAGELTEELTKAYASDAA